MSDMQSFFVASNLVLEGHSSHVPSVFKNDLELHTSAEHVLLF